MHTACRLQFHTIGDACLDRVLSAYEKALAENLREDHRHGIVHCQITRADQLEKSRKCIFTFTHRASSSITITIS